MTRNKHTADGCNVIAPMIKMTLKNSINLLASRNGVIITAKQIPLG